MLIIETDLEKISKTCNYIIFAILYYKIIIQNDFYRYGVKLYIIIFIA